MVKVNGAHAAPLQEYAGEGVLPGNCTVSRCQATPVFAAPLVVSKKRTVKLCEMHVLDWGTSPEHRALRPTSFMDWLYRVEKQEQKTALRDRLAAAEAEAKAKAEAEEKK